MGLKEIIERALDKGISKSEIVEELLDKGYKKNEIDEAFGVKKVVRGTRRVNNEIGFFDKIKLLFSSPISFFQLVREGTIKHALLMYIFIGPIFTFLGGVLLYSIGIFYGISSSFYYGFSLFYPFVAFGISVGLTFAYAGISHLVIRGLGGEGDYVDTYNACTYSVIPALIITAIPYIGWLSIIYSIVLMTFGLSAYHNIVKGKAVIAVLVPIIIAVLLFGLLIAYFIFSIFRYGF